ncbi:MAG: hypothetical protein AB7F86_17330 [Bdellovibrionales bacterium]
MKYILACILTLSVLWPYESHAGRISTYLRGHVIKKSRTLWILNNKNGTYWIKVNRRPPSYTTRFGNNEMGFWVEVKAIKKFRPAAKNLSAAID